MLAKFLDRLGLRLLTRGNARVIVLESTDSVLLMRSSGPVMIPAILDTEMGIRNSMVVNIVGSKIAEALA